MSALTPLYPISGQTGSVTQTAVQGALSGGGTIWFQWTPAIGDDYIFFKTRGGGAVFTNFFSSIAIYLSSVSNPTDTSQLTPVALIYDQSQGVGAGFEMGAYAAFLAAESATYVIGITARQLPAGAANLYLAWGEYAPFTLGDCNTGLKIGFGGKCVGQVVVPANPLSNWYMYLSFGSFAAAPGFYSCTGVATPPRQDAFIPPGGSQYVFNVQTGGDPGWTNPNPPTPFTEPIYYNVSSQANGPVIPFGCSWVNFNAPAGEIAVVMGSLWGAEDTYCGGCSVYFSAEGPACPGDAQCFIDPDGNSGAYLGPGQCVYVPSCATEALQVRFLLYYTDCLISYFSLTALPGTSASGSNWQMQPTFLNSYSLYGWDGVTIDLEINGVDTGVTETVTFAAGGSQTPTFTFSATPTSALLTATFVFSRNGVQFGTIANVPLYPVGTIGTPNLFGEGNIGGDTITFTSNLGNCVANDNQIDFPFVATNGGGDPGVWFGGDIQFALAVTGGATLLDFITCDPITTIGQNSRFVITKPTSKSGTLTLTPQYVISGTVIASFPSQTYNLVWP